jgi:hypothetical protein
MPRTNLPRARRTPPAPIISKPPRKLVNEERAAEVLDVTPRVLSDARKRKKMRGDIDPPPYYKLGHFIRYDLGDLEEWLAKRRVDPSTRAAG